MELPVEITQVNSRSLALVLFRCERAVIELYGRIQLRTHVREHADMLRVVSTRVAVKKAIQSTIKSGLLLTMAMQVQNESNFPFLADVLEETFDARHFRASCILFSGIPLPVQILPSQIGPVVPKDHSIRVHHRDHIDHIVLS